MSPATSAVFVTLVFASADAGGPAFPDLTPQIPRPGHPFLRWNDVEFIGVSSISWKESMHSVTEGQPWGGASVHQPSWDHAGLLRVEAGRRASSQPAVAFLDGLDFDVHVMGLGTN